MFVRVLCICTKKNLYIIFIIIFVRERERKSHQRNKFAVQTELFSFFLFVFSSLVCVCIFWYTNGVLQEHVKRVVSYENWGIQKMLYVHHVNLHLNLNTVFDFILLVVFFFFFLWMPVEQYMRSVRLFI